jgi:hypothetical protein
MNSLLDKEKPFWKRILGGTRFNYSPFPLPDRNERCIDCTKVALLNLKLKIDMKGLKM